VGLWCVGVACPPPLEAHAHSYTHTHTHARTHTHTHAAVFFTVTDRVAMRVEREMGLRYSASLASESLAIPALAPPASLTERAVKFFVENRYAIIGYGWAGVVGGSLLYTWKRRDIPLTQKLINARLLSQTMALLGMGLIAALTANVAAPPKVDAYFDRILQEGELRAAAAVSASSSAKKATPSA
jgi:hypothetical protein